MSRPRVARLGVSTFERFEDCERFHLNLWMGNYRSNTSPHPPPKTMPYEVVVSNFEFAPIKRSPAALRASSIAPHGASLSR